MLTGAQAEASIDGIARLREAVETSFANVVRLLLFLTGIGEFYPVDKAGECGFGGCPVPFLSDRGTRATASFGATGHDGDRGSMWMPLVPKADDRKLSTGHGHHSITYQPSDRVSLLNEGPVSLIWYVDTTTFNVV